MPNAWFWDWVLSWYTSVPSGVPPNLLGGGSSSLLDRLIRSIYFDPRTGEWRYPDFSITVTTTAPRPTDTTPGSSGSIWTPSFPPPLQGRPPLIGPWEPRPPGQDLFGGGGGPSIPEKPEPRPEVGIVDWRWDPDTGEWLPVFAEKPEPDPEAGIVDWIWNYKTGQWIPVYSVTGVTSPPDESKVTPVTSPLPSGSGTSRTPSTLSGWIYDPFRGVYVPYPPIIFSVTTYTSPPQETTTQTETTTATEGWIYDPFRGVYIPYPPITFSVTTYTSPPQETTTQTETTTTTVTETGGTVTFPPGWIYDPIRDVYIPIPGITFVVDVTTTRPEEEYHTSPLPTTIGAPGRTTPWPPLTFTTTWTTWQDTTTTSTETTTTDTTTTVVTPPPPPPPPEGGGAGAPMPGPPAPVVGRPLGESVWQLSQYIPALVPHLGYFLAGR